MTDNEIIKALEYCHNSVGCPVDCPLHESDDDCFLILNKPILDLINRQKAEIERLKKIKENSLEIISTGEKQILEIREKSIKEFAEWDYKDKKAAFEAAKEWVFAYIENLKRELILNPSADVVEVVHGEWIQGNTTSQECSCCGFEIDDDVSYEMYFNCYAKPKFCPRMRCENGWKKECEMN